MSVCKDAPRIVNEETCAIEDSRRLLYVLQVACKSLEAAVTVEASEVNMIVLY